MPGYGILEWLGGLALFRAMNRAGEIGFVDNRDAGGRLKMKLRFWNGDVFLPIAEPKFGFDVPGLAKHDADEPGLRTRFEKHLTQ